MFNLVKDDFDENLDDIMNSINKIINDEKKFTGTYSKKDLCDNDRIIVTRLD